LSSNPAPFGARAAQPLVVDVNLPRRASPIVPFGAVEGLVSAVISSAVISSFAHRPCGPTGRHTISRKAFDRPVQIGADTRVQPLCRSAALQIPMHVGTQR